VKELTRANDVSDVVGALSTSCRRSSAQVLLGGQSVWIGYVASAKEHSSMHHAKFCRLKYRLVGNCVMRRSFMTMVAGRTWQNCVTEH